MFCNKPNSACEILYIDPKELKPSKYSRKDIDEVEYQLLKENIKHNKVLEPIHITRDNFVRSGWLRKEICEELGIEVPCIICEDAQDDNEEEFLNVSHNIHHTTKPSEIWHMHQVLARRYGIKQGVRSDLDPRVQEGKSLMGAFFPSKSTLDRIKYIGENAPFVFDNDEAKIKQFWDDVDSRKTSVSRACRRLKEKVAKKRNSKAIPLIAETRTDLFKLIQKDSAILDLNDTEDLVDLVVTSTPYAFGMRDYDNGPKEFGQEKTIDEYLTNMQEFMNNCKKLLKPEGSLWVNIGDCVRDGEYQLVPEQFVMMMKKDGWKVNEKIVWQKNNPQPGHDLRREVMSVEYLYQFVRERDFYYNMDWKNEIPQVTLQTLGESEESLELQTLIEKSLRNSVLTTNSSSTKGLKKKCEENGFTSTHCATYPISVPLIAILSSTKPGDTVLDIFNGTGTTGEAAIQLGRYYIGCDVNPEFLRSSQIRLESLTSQLDQKIAA